MITKAGRNGRPGTPGVVKKAPVCTKVVKTGDSSRTFTFEIMFVLAGVALAGAVTYRRKSA